VTFLSTAILFVLGTEVEEDISNALVMIITYRGYVNRFRVQTRYRADKSVNMRGYGSLGTEHMYKRA
jgi:hypothetical protein